MNFFPEILFVTLTGLLNFESTDAQFDARSIPKNSVEIRMKDGSIYRKSIKSLKDQSGIKEPSWMDTNSGAYPPCHHDVYLNLGDNVHYGTKSFLKLHYAGPNHKPQEDKPAFAFINLNNNKFLSAAGFTKFDHGTSGFDKDEHIFVVLPEGPIYKAVIQQNSLPTTFG